MIRKLQKEEETETGKEAKSVKRIMAAVSDGCSGGVGHAN